MTQTAFTATITGARTSTTCRIWPPDAGARCYGITGTGTATHLGTVTLDGTDVEHTTQPLDNCWKAGSFGDQLTDGNGHLYILQLNGKFCATGGNPAQGSGSGTFQLANNGGAAVSASGTYTESVDASGHATLSLSGTITY